MKDKEVDISVCIVNWNGQDIIKNCLTSIFKYRENLNIEIIVIDNASSDKSTQIIELEFPDVILIKNCQNEGFGKANNQAIKISRGRYIFVLNPDIVLIESCFKRMIHFFEVHKDTGCIGCKMINRNGSIQKSYFSNFPTPLSEFREGLLVNKMSNIFLRNQFNNNQPMKVAWIVGACMMFPRFIMEKLVGFNEQYFMYGEDIDLCFRTNNLGYNIYYLSDIQMLHLHATSSTKKVRKHFSAVLQKESVYRFMKLHYGLLTSNLFRFTWMISGLVRLILLTPVVMFFSIVSNKKRKIFFFTFEKYMRIIFWCFGFEKWSRKQVPE